MSLLAVAVAFLIIDCVQTVHIARNPALYFERNPLLGRHPSVPKVLWYFAAWIVGTVAVSAHSQIVGMYLNLAVIGVEAVVVVRNLLLFYRTEIKA